MAANTSGSDLNLSTACDSSGTVQEDLKADRSIIRKIRKHDSSRLKNSSLLKAANRSLVCAKLQTVNRELANGYQFFKIRCEQLDRQVIELAEHCRMLTTENSQLADLVDTLLTQRSVEIQKQRAVLTHHVTKFRRLVPQRATRMDKLLRSRAVAADVYSQPSSQQNSRVHCGLASADSTARGDVEEFEPDESNANQTVNQTLNQSRLPFMYKPVGRAPPPLATDPTLSTIEASTNEVTIPIDTGNTSAATQIGALAQIIDCAEPVLCSPTQNSAPLSESSYSEIQEPHAASTQQRPVAKLPQLPCESPEITSRVNHADDDLSEAKYDKVKRSRRYSSLIGAAEVAPEPEVDPDRTISRSEVVTAIETAPQTNDDTVILSGFGLANGQKYAGPSRSKTHEKSHQYRKRNKGKSATKATSQAKELDTGAEKSANPTESTKHRKVETEIKVKRRSVITGLDHAIHRKRVTKQENIKPSQETANAGKAAGDVYDGFVETTSQDDCARSAIISRINQSRLLTQSNVSSRRTSVCESVSSNSTNDPTASKTRFSGDAQQSELTTESLIDAFMAKMDRRATQKGRRARTVEHTVQAPPPAGAGESEKRTVNANTSGNGLSLVDANAHCGTKRLDRSTTVGGVNTRRRSRLMQVETLDDPTSCGISSSVPATNSNPTDQLVNEILKAKPTGANEKTQSPSTNENPGLRRSKRSSILSRSYAEFDLQPYR